MSHFRGTTKTIRQSQANATLLAGGAHQSLYVNYAWEALRSKEMGAAGVPQENTWQILLVQAATIVAIPVLPHLHPPASAAVLLTFGSSVVHNVLQYQATTLTLNLFALHAWKDALTVHGTYFAANVARGMS